jgi:ESCRT-II complex subunit VPS25
MMDTGKITPNHLSNIMEAMAEKNLATYEPPKQARSILIYWRLPEEWAEVLYHWVCMQF